MIQMQLTTTSSKAVAGQLLASKTLVYTFKLSALQNASCKQHRKICISSLLQLQHIGRVRGSYLHGMLRNMTVETGLSCSSKVLRCPPCGKQVVLVLSLGQIVSELRHES